MEPLIWIYVSKVKRFINIHCWESYCAQSWVNFIERLYRGQQKSMRWSVFSRITTSWGNTTHKANFRRQCVMQDWTELWSLDGTDCRSPEMEDNTGCSMQRRLCENRTKTTFFTLHSGLVFLGPLSNCKILVWTFHIVPTFSALEAALVSFISRHLNATSSLLAHRGGTKPERYANTVMDICFKPWEVSHKTSFSIEQMLCKGVRCLRN